VSGRRRDEKKEIDVYDIDVTFRHQYNKISRRCEKGRSQQAALILIESVWACLFFFLSAGSGKRSARARGVGGACELRKERKSVPHDKHYNSARHKAWAEKVLRRAGYLCEECRRYGRLDKNGLPVRATTAHHIKHRDEYPELQYVVSNGRALCERCHNKAHPEKGGAHGHYWD